MSEKEAPAAFQSQSQKPQKEIETMVVRFAGDSGDGMQLVGEQFTSTSAIMGEFFATLPDYPSEIRAPAGTVYGVSGFQICIGGKEVFTPGDNYDVLMAMNPAALKTNLPGLHKKGIVIVNEDSFIQKNLEKAGYTSNPLDSAELKEYQLVRVHMSTLTQKALEGSGLTAREADRCKNFFALGMMYWLVHRDPSFTNKWLEKKFGSKPEILAANRKALEAGWRFVDEGQTLTHQFKIKKTTKVAPGVYRNVTGNTAAALGLIAAAQKSGLKLFLGSYPITPATDILHELTKHKDFATIFQAEDEIAAIGATLGASFGGALAATNTSGPGFSLKSEFMNLACIVELPMVIINVQRAGPSTGLPTKTEQSDLMQALYGRHGESPLIVLAASSPKDCFTMVYEAARLTTKYMTPVIVLSEGYLGNGSEVWKVPSLDELPQINVAQRKDPNGFMPYLRDPETLARPWAIPGTPGLEHRLGGLEKEDGTGAVSHSPTNHQKMVKIREDKVKRVANEIPPMSVFGHPEAELLVMGWGGTEGVIKETVRRLSLSGVKVACTHLKYLNPMPKDLKPLLQKYKKVLIPETNSGQLWFRIRGEFLLDVERLNKVQGQPFRSDEIEAKIMQLLG